MPNLPNHTSTTHAAAADTASKTSAAPFWGRPVRYTIAVDGSTKLYATAGRSTRVVTTLRTAVGEDTAQQVADDLSHLVHLADVDRLPNLLKQLAAAGVDVSGVSNLDAASDPTVGTTLHLSKLLDRLPPSAAADDPALWVARPLLRTLAACAAEPDATRRALLDEVRRILHPLDGPVVRGEYEYAGVYNVAPWIDTLTADQLRLLVTEADYVDYDALTRELLIEWSDRGGILEDEARVIENDTDFKLLVDPVDVVRRLASTRPEVLAQVYTDDVWADYADDTACFGDAARLAAAILGR